MYGAEWIYDRQHFHLLITWTEIRAAPCWGCVGQPLFCSQTHLWRVLVSRYIVNPYSCANSTLWRQDRSRSLLNLSESHSCCMIQWAAWKMFKWTWRFYWDFLPPSQRLTCAECWLHVGTCFMCINSSKPQQTFEENTWVPTKCL